MESAQVPMGPVPPRERHAARRLAIVAHWDPRGDAAPHFLRLLEQLGEHFEKIVVASPAPLTPDAESEISARAELLRRGNYGYDFGSWRDGLEQCDWAAGFDEVLLTNDSYVGFFRPLGEILDEMSSRPVDVWGITRTSRVNDHIQSYFLYFTASVVRSQAFLRYWTNMKLAKDRRAAILAHEVGISRAMVDAGFRLGSYFEPNNDERADAIRRGEHWLNRRTREFRERFPRPVDNYFDPRRGNGLGEANFLNWSSAFADAALAEGRLPVLKLDVLRYDPFWLDSEALFRAMEAEYPERMESVRDFIKVTAPFYAPRPNENGGPAVLTAAERQSARMYAAPPLGEGIGEIPLIEASMVEAKDISILVNSGVVDPIYYAAQHGGDPLSMALTAEHYVLEGDRLGYSVNPLLDVSVMRDALKNPDRPTIAAWLRSKNWQLRTSRVWWPGHYAHVVPESLEHRSGPVGHLTEAVKEAADTRVSFAAAAGRHFPWKNAYEGMLRATRAHEMRARSATARRRENELAHAECLDLAWDPEAPEPLVSIIMPVRNRAGELRTAVDSVLAQTWKNWELIIVDDGSTDDSLLVEEVLAASDGRIRVEKRKHGGVSAARNAGLDRAEGKWIAFLDSDNTWLPHFLHDMVTGLTTANAEAGYASLSLTDEKGTTYRNGAPTGANLLAGNWIDLNVLVVSREQIEAVGGFDTALRRAVDYDLVLRLAARTEVVHVATLGAAYDNFETGDERISTTEAYGWNTAVRLRNAPMVNPSSLVPGTTVIGIVQGGDPHDVFSERLLKLRDLAAQPETQLIIAAVGCSVDEHNAMTIAAATLRNVRILPFEPHDTFAFVVDIALGSVARNTLVVLDPRAQFTHELVSGLADAVRERPGSAVAPVMQAERLTVHALGSMLAGAKMMPAPLLAGHPMDDAAVLPELTEVPLLQGRTFAISTEALLGVGGLDPLLTNEFELEGLSLALKSASPEARVFAATRHISRLVRPERSFRTRDLLGTRTTFGSREYPVSAVGDAGVYEALGLQVAAWRSFPMSEKRPDEPIVVRRRETAVVQGREIPRLRWAIKTSSPAGRAGESWGDTHFARSLAKALRSLGQYVAVDTREHQRRHHDHLDDVVIVLRGLDEFVPLRGPLSYMWLLSHPDLVSAREARGYDRVFAASTRWARETGEQWGLAIEPLLQCTDPSLFHPEGLERGDGVVFVGNSRNVPRPVVMESVRGGVPIEVYGGGWDNLVPADVVHAPYVANDEVRHLYGSASVVLNDHWSDMARQGFISNRIFDAVASGGRVFSDHVEGIEETFGGAVHTYSSVKDVAPALLGDHDALFASDSELERISARIREEHSFRARADVLLDRVLTDLGVRQELGT